MIIHPALPRCWKNVRCATVLNKPVPKEVYLLHEPMAAALGIGIDVEPVGNMIIDIGGGTTGITVIA